LRTDGTWRRCYRFAAGSDPTNCCFTRLFANSAARIRFVNDEIRNCTWGKPNFQVSQLKVRT
jgi:hypothetical protein